MSLTNADRSRTFRRIFIASPHNYLYFFNAMIVCPVCQHSNDKFSIKCVSCGSYIQDRVPNLDFFAIVWMMIESPSQAFRKIIIAEHKNFVLFLALFLGIGASFTLMWAKRSGNSFDNLFPLLLFGIAIGLIICIPLFYLLAGLFHATAKLLKGKAAFKETYGIIGWSLVPIMFSVVFVLPLELSTLGLLFFSTNPNAYEVKPVVTMVLRGLDSLMVLWSVILASLGISMAHRFRFLTSLILVALVVGTVSYISFIIYSSFNI